MKPPFIIVENGDVEMFSCHEAALKDLEAIDVRNGEYIGFDADGYRLSITADEYDNVQISRTLPPDSCPKELEVILREYAIRVGFEKSDVANIGMPQLISLVAKYAFIC